MAKKLTDSEILSLLKDGVAAGVRFNDTKLSKERKRVMDYYNGLLPAPGPQGQQPYVSTDVFDCVEVAKGSSWRRSAPTLTLSNSAPRRRSRGAGRGRAGDRLHQARYFRTERRHRAIRLRSPRRPDGAQRHRQGLLGGQDGKHRRGVRPTSPRTSWRSSPTTR
jgi:hypothetical protein